MNKTCPLGHTCENCLWFTRIRGSNIQTGNDEDKTDCVLNILPVLLIENARLSYSVGAAIESFRNEVVQQNGFFLGLVQSAAERKQLEN